MYNSYRIILHSLTLLVFRQVGSPNFHLIYDKVTVDYLFVLIVSHAFVANTYSAILNTSYALSYLVDYSQPTMINRRSSGL